MTAKSLDEMQGMSWIEVPELLKMTPKEACHQVICDRLMQIQRNYFANYVMPPAIEGVGVEGGKPDPTVATHTCICCGEPMNGSEGKLAFEFNAEGNGTGKAFCQSCGYPYRYLHRLLDESGDMITAQPILLMLPYHPKCITVDDFDPIWRQT